VLSLRKNESRERLGLSKGWKEGPWGEKELHVCKAAGYSLTIKSLGKREGVSPNSDQKREGIGQLVMIKDDCFQD